MITWKITNIEYIESHDGKSNVVKNVHWYCHKTDNEGNFGNCWGNQQFDVTNLNPNTFVDFERLSETQVIDWVKDALGAQLATIEKFVNDTINKKETTQRHVGLPSSWS